MDHQTIPWEAISAKLNNDADSDQQNQIQDWLDGSPEHLPILQEIANTWYISGRLPEFYQPDMSNNWRKLMRRIDNRQNQNYRFLPFLKLLVAAAVLILVFLAGVSLSDQLMKPVRAVSYTKIISPKGNKTRVILPDSSKVWLNSGSELWYSTNYSAQNRELWMKGECYFEVEKDPAHPLLVHGTKLNLKVLGTTFNIKEDESRDISDVTLLTGKVRIFDNKDATVSDLAPGQQFIYRDGTGKVQQADNPDASTAWINNMLIFDNQPFEEVVRYLDGWYGVEIHIDHTVYYRHNYTFKIKTESLREVFELISIMTPIDYTIEGDQVKIKYKPKVQ